jgi:orotidine-5'-phosphate decarboxylase
VGIDIIPDLIPDQIKKKKRFIQYFVELAIDSASEFAGAFKFNLAFYEALGAEGYRILEKNLKYVPTGIEKIGDAKRGDIDSTSKFYAKSLFTYFGFNSVTLNPLMGYDSLVPFFEYKDKFNYVLTLTSNRGADDFQKLKLRSGESLSLYILKKIKSWNSVHKNLGIVFGATQKKEFQLLNSSVKNLKILIPGIGAQGGDLEFVLNHLKKNKLDSFFINSSRGILYRNLKDNVPKSINENARRLKTLIDQIYNN